MRSLTRALAMLAALALALSAAATAVILRSDHLDLRGLQAGLGVATAVAWIGTGLYVWWRRPSSRFGALMAAVGFAWFLSALTAANTPAVFTLGVLLSGLYIVLFVQVLLSYPDGRLQRRAHRVVLAGGYAIAVVGMAPVLMWGWSQRNTGCNCPRSIIQVSDATGPGDVLNALTSAIAVGLVVYVLWCLIDRWRRATGPQRRSVAPLLWSGVSLMVVLAAQLSADAVGLSAVDDVLGLVGAALFASVPLVFLFGLLRTRVAQAGAVGDLLQHLGAEPGTGSLRDRLADALGDRSLELIYWLDDRHGWVDRDGRPAKLPDPGDPARAWTSVDLEGRRVGAIVHDVTLCEEPEVLASVAAAAGLAVHNERLQAELRARVEQLRASRARIIEVGVLERRRLERDLHDGAQQRLVALSLTMRMAQGKVRKDPEKAEALLAEAQTELATALGELRELARGIHPAVLADRGLTPALEALAGRSPVPVQLADLPEERLPTAIEAAAYFVVAEALTNVVKYAHASAATVAVHRRNGSAVVEVSDDGIGGADPERGSGLRGLADRIAALDGSLSLDSPAGSGTTLRAEIPV